MRVISLKRRSGSFVNEAKQTINYDNLVFTCEVPNQNNLFGPDFKDVKIKYSDFVNSYKGDLKGIQDKDAVFYFDADGHYLGCNIK